jgi:hypothetical protein
MRITVATMLAAIPAAVACGGAGHNGVATNATDPTLRPVSTPAATPAPLAAMRDATPPTAIRSFNIGYDPATRRLILHAGVDLSGAGSYISATWAWDGSRWSELSPRSELPAQSDGAMAVDPVSGRLMFMGGDAFSESTDSNGNNVPHWAPNLGTWLWDGATWTRVADNPRQGGDPALAVDQATRQLVVNSPDIRGVRTTDDLEAQGPSWYGQGSYRWTGRAWTKVRAQTDATLQPLGAAIAYDPISRRLIQFGGSEQNPVNDVLAYDGTHWVKLDPTTVPPAGPAAAATDETAGQIVLLTANLDNPKLTATWTWDGGDWVRHVVNEPSADVLGSAQMVWDPALARIILVAGTGRGPVRLWAWDGTDNGWQRLPG